MSQKHSATAIIFLYISDAGNCLAYWKHLIGDVQDKDAGTAKACVHAAWNLPQ